MVGESELKSYFHFSLNQWLPNLKSFFFLNRLPTPFSALFPLLILNLLGVETVCFPVPAGDRGSQGPGIRLTHHVQC